MLDCKIPQHILPGCDTGGSAFRSRIFPDKHGLCAFAAAALSTGMLFTSEGVVLSQISQTMSDPIGLCRVPLLALPSFRKTS